MSDNLLLENNGRMLVATFNRPEDNKGSDGMARELSAALATAHETSEMVLLKSAGPDFAPAVYATPMLARRTRRPIPAALSTI